MPFCAVSTCRSRSGGFNGSAEGVTFHPFPINEELKAKWIEMTGRDNWTPQPDSFICSRHFRDSDYIIKRSGNRYLKISAVPCEYVVYRQLYSDEEASSSAVQSNEAEANVTGMRHALEAEQTGPWRPLAPLTVRTSSIREPDTTFTTDFNFNDNSLRDWDRFRPERYFGRAPTPSLFDESAVDSTGCDYDIDERSHRDVRLVRTTRSSVDLQPHLQVLPPSWAPEPTPTSPEREPTLAPVPSPSDEPESAVKIAEIRKLVSKRKHGKKAISAALEEVREAKLLEIKLQSGQMSDYDKAAGIIAIQTRQIAKLTLKHRRLKRIIKRISAVLRKVV